MRTSQSGPHYFYLLPFRKSRHFKIGVTSGLSYSRLRVHIRNFSIYPKDAILVFGHPREVSDLECFIKNKFSSYKRADEVKAIYGAFDGYTEVFSQDCLHQVKDVINTWSQMSGTSLSISPGLSLKNIYTDNNIDQTNFKDEVQQSEPLVLTELYQHLTTVLNSSQVTRVNFGFNKKVSYFGLQYLIEAEEGFKDHLFDTQFTQTETFNYGSLEVQHLFCSGQKLKSGGTYLRGRIDLVRLLESYHTGSREGDIKAINDFFKPLVNNPMRDENFKIKCQYSVRNKFVANFQSYEAGQEVRIGKGLNSPDSLLW